MNTTRTTKPAVSRSKTRAVRSFSSTGAGRAQVAESDIRTDARALPAGSAALRALTLLEKVASAERSISLDELVKSTGLSKPTAFRLLALLERAGMLLRDPAAEKRYATGPRLAALALDVLRNSPARAERHAILQHLVEEIGETCNVTLLDGTEVFYLDRVETSWPLRLHLQPGSRVPLHCTSSGKLFLSQMPPARRDILLGNGSLPRFTARTITDRTALDAELARINAEQVSADNEEFLAGIVCLAVPVRDREGKMFAAVALQAPVARLTLADCRRHLPALRGAAAALADSFAPDNDGVRTKGKERRQNRK